MDEPPPSAAARAPPAPDKMLELDESVLSPAAARAPVIDEMVQLDELMPPAAARAPVPNEMVQLDESVLSPAAARAPVMDETVQLDELMPPAAARAPAPDEMAQLDESLPPVAARAPVRDETTNAMNEFDSSVFAKIPDEECVEWNPDAFLHGKNGIVRNRVAACQAKLRAVKLVKDTILKFDNKEQAAIAIRGAFHDPAVAPIALASGYDPNITVMKFQHEQMKKIIDQASSQKTSQGRLSNDADSYIRGLVMGVVGSPDRPITDAPSKRQQVDALGLPWKRGQKLFDLATKAHGEIKMDPTVKYNRCREHKKAITITAEIVSMVQAWVREHQDVINSPIANDTLLIRDPETGVKKWKNKLLLQISVAELHNHLAEAARNRDLPGLLNAQGKLIISDTSFCKILPPELC